MKCLIGGLIKGLIEGLIGGVMKGLIGGLIHNVMKGLKEGVIANLIGWESQKTTPIIKSCGSVNASK